MRSNRLKRESPDENDSENRSNEELYEKLFPKMGRDFIHRDDLERIIGHLMTLLDPLGLTGLDLDNCSGAIARAREYQNTLDSGQDGTKLYRDLIDLDD